MNRIFINGHRNLVRLFSTRYHCGELRPSNVSQEVKVSGWLQFQRLNGKFFTLRDGHGVTQVIVPDDSLELLKIVETASLESIIEVIGEVKLRPDGLKNSKMATGEIEIVAKSVTILNQCLLEPQPFQVNRASSVNEFTRLQYRYIDLRSTEMQEAIRTRSAFIQCLRRFFIDSNRFTEVETPLLFRKTPAGAREFIVPTRNIGHYFCLPQSPQQFKQVLMASGIDRYFQIARCFRDESARVDRQPEFTQMDIEMAFSSEQEVQSLVEHGLLQTWPLFKNITSPQPPIPFQRMKYSDAIENYGTDKPDLRFPWKIEKSKSHEFIVFSGCYKMFTGGQDGKRNLFDLEKAIAQKYPNSKCYILKLTKNVKKMKSVGNVYCPKEVCSEILETFKCDSVNEDSLVVVSPSIDHAKLWLGQARQFICMLCEKVGWPPGADLKNRFEWLWIYDFPMFCPETDEATTQSKIGIECGHHPFTGKQFSN